MRIDGGYRAQTSGRAGATRPGGGGETFQISQDTGGAARSGAPAPAAATSGIEALLALQSVDDPLNARRKGVRRGRSLLDVLESIKVDLLIGRVGEGRLNTLMALVTSARERADPELESLLDDIELRARVELAKHGRYAAA